MTVTNIGTATADGGLPSPPSADGASAYVHGLMLFAFVLRSGVAATLSDRELDLALHSSIVAVAAPDLLDVTRARFVDIRRLLVTTLEARREYAQMNGHEPAAGAPPNTDGSVPEPRRPRPSTNPPATHAADLAPTTIAW